MSLLVDALGTDAVVALCRIVGGRRLYVPTFSPNGRSVEGRARLVALLGARMAEDLITNFAGTYVHVPKADGPCPWRSLDHSQVMAMTRKNFSADEIAQHLSCSVRTVYQVRAKHQRSALSTRKSARKFRERKNHGCRPT